MGNGTLEGKRTEHPLLAEDKNGYGCFVSYIMIRFVSHIMSKLAPNIGNILG